MESRTTKTDSNSSQWNGAIRYNKWRGYFEIFLFQCENVNRTHIVPIDKKLRMSCSYLLIFLWKLTSWKALMQLLRYMCLCIRSTIPFLAGYFTSHIIAEGVYYSAAKWSGTFNYQTVLPIELISALKLLKQFSSRLPATFPPPPCPWLPHSFSLLLTFHIL
jgi:hypothetical protein